jgi:hypothetical protein
MFPESQLSTVAAHTARAAAALGTRRRQLRARRLARLELTHELWLQRNRQTTPAVGRTAWPSLRVG